MLREPRAGDDPDQRQNGTDSVIFLTSLFSADSRTQVMDSVQGSPRTPLRAHHSVSRLIYKVVQSDLLCKFSLFSRTTGPGATRSIRFACYATLFVTPARCDGYCRTWNDASVIERPGAAVPADWNRTLELSLFISAGW